MLGVSASLDKVAEEAPPLETTEQANCRGQVLFLIPRAPESALLPKLVQMPFVAQ